MTDVPQYGFADTSYLAAGEYEGIQRLIDCFYAYMDDSDDPAVVIIRDMHPKDLSESRDKLTCFLVGWMGGPKEYAERYGAIHIPRVHQHLRVGYAEKDAWLQCMQYALDQQPYADSFKTYLMQQLHFPAERIRQTSQSD